MSPLLSSIRAANLPEAHAPWPPLGRPPAASVALKWLKKHQAVLLAKRWPLHASRLESMLRHELTRAGVPQEVTAAPGLHQRRRAASRLGLVSRLEL